MYTNSTAVFGNLNTFSGQSIGILSQEKEPKEKNSNCSLIRCPNYMKRE